MRMWDSLSGSVGRKRAVFFSLPFPSVTMTVGGSLGALASIEASKLAYSSLLVVKALSIDFRFSGDMFAALFFSTPLLTLVPLDRIDIMLPLRLVLECPLLIGFSSTLPSFPPGNDTGCRRQQTCRQGRQRKKLVPVQSWGNAGNLLVQSFTFQLVETKLWNSSNFLFGVKL